MWVLHHADTRCQRTKKSYERIIRKIREHIEAFCPIAADPDEPFGIKLEDLEHPVLINYLTTYCRKGMVKSAMIFFVVVQVYMRMYESVYV